MLQQQLAIVLLALELDFQLRVSFYQFPVFVVYLLRNLRHRLQVFVQLFFFLFEIGSVFSFLSFLIFDFFAHPVDF